MNGDKQNEERPKRCTRDKEKKEIWILYRGKNMARINKEKKGITVRFSIRLPKEVHRWLKEKSANSERYKSMNTIIEEILREKMP